MKIFIFVIALIIMPGWANAENTTAHMTASQERRADDIGYQLRCLVCQNENIADSSASLAIQLRQIIREKIAAGESNAQIKKYMVQRYGIFILLKPPFSPITLLLYASPFLALLIGCGFFYVSRRQIVNPPLPLTESDKARINELLK